MRLLIYFLPIVIFVQADAQKIEVKKAERQNWHGGIPGRMGSNFHFELAFQKVKGSIVLDTLWIEGNPILMVAKEKDGSYGGNFTVSKYLTGKKRAELFFSINAGISNMGNKNVPPPKEYKGVALLSYRYNGKRYYYAIPKLTLMHDPINYP